MLLHHKVERGIVWYRPRDQHAAAFLADAYPALLRDVEEYWELGFDGFCEIGIGEGWMRFVLAGQPWTVWPIVATDIVVYWLVAGVNWRRDGSMTICFDDSFGIFIKAPLSSVDPGSDEEVAHTYRTTLCHELTRLVLRSARLPKWLWESLAVVTTNRLLGETFHPPVPVEKVTDVPLPWARRTWGRAGTTQAYLAGMYLHDHHPALLREMMRPSNKGTANRLLAAHFNCSQKDTFAVVLRKAFRANAE